MLCWTSSSPTPETQGQPWLQFRILKREHSKLTTLYCGKADFALFSDLLVTKLVKIYRDATGFYHSHSTEINLLMAAEQVGLLQSSCEMGKKPLLLTLHSSIVRLMENVSSVASFTYL